MKKKKLFKKNFDNLQTNNIKLNEHDNLLFDYFKWIKNRYSINKSISPSSNFIKNFEIFILKRLQDYFKVHEGFY